MDLKGPAGGTGQDAAKGAREGGVKGAAKEAVKGTVRRAGKKAARGAAVKGAAWAIGASAPVLLPVLAILLLLVTIMALLSSQGPENDPWALPATPLSCDAPASQPSGGPSGTPGGPGPGGLTAKQYQIEQLIVQEGEKNHIPDLGIIAALDTAHQESEFHDYASRSDPPSLNAPMSDGPPATNNGYGDHGSLGVFQQQTTEPPMNNPYGQATANWGSWQQLMDPATAADLFYQALLQKGAMSQSPNPGIEAQIVQVSATPLAYINWNPDSEAAFRQITGHAPNMSQPAGGPSGAQVGNPGTPGNVPVSNPNTNGQSCSSAGGGGGNISAYKDPFRSVQGLTMTRIDQGVDATGSGPVYPVTDGTIVSHAASGWCGGCTSPDSYTVVKVSNGPAAGKFIYYAEACVLNPGLQVGSQVNVNTPMCVMNPTSIEFGWAQGPQNELPMAATWYHSHPDGSETNYGQNFNDLLVALGNPTAHHQPGTPVEPMPAPGLPTNWKKAGSPGGGGWSGKTLSCNPNAPGLIPQNAGVIGGYLLSNGYSKNATAGILGNMYRESHGDPESVGTGGGGLIGFTPLPPGYVTGNPQKDMQTQLPAVLKFNQIWSQYIPMLNAASSPTVAADIYVKYFERAGVPAAAEREQSATDVAAACGL